MPALVLLAALVFTVAFAVSVAVPPLASRRGKLGALTVAGDVTVALWLARVAGPWDMVSAWWWFALVVVAAMSLAWLVLRWGTLALWPRGGRGRKWSVASVVVHVAFWMGWFVAVLG